MKLFLFYLTIAIFVLPPVRAEEPAEPTAEEIVRLVHLSRALKKHDLNGELRKGENRAPLNIKLADKAITITFANPKQVIQLDLGATTYKLYEVTAGSNKEVPAAKYAEGIRGMDLTYEDASFRYLYWPKPVKLAAERINTRKCWKVQLNNPNTKIGAYTSVLIWVDQESGALMKMEGYKLDQSSGKPKWTLLKRCRVTEGMKIDDATVLKEMTVEAFDANGKGLGKTFLELEKPSK